MPEHNPTAEMNWAGNYSYGAAAVHHPRTEGELRSLVAGSGSVRALGSRHSFNALADSDVLVSLDSVAADIRIDTGAMTATVGGGTRYGVLAKELARQGFALHNLASLPHISVAGAIATATHGSGDGNPNLAAAVTGLRLVDAEGNIRTLSRAGTEDFAGYVVGLGALGIVTEVTLAIEPAFEVAQHVYLELPWDAVLADFGAVTGRAYSVSLFTNFAAGAIGQAWFKQRLGDGRAAEFPASLLGGRAATEAVHPVPGVPALNCTEQLGASGPWENRLAHFRMDYLPSSGAEIQSEWLIGREHAAAAVSALRARSEEFSPLLQVAEIRTIAADDLWLSTAYGRDSVAFHFTWFRDPAAVAGAVRVVEEALAPFRARPHWGKVFSAGAAELAPLYPRFADFTALARSLDPVGKFRNGFLEQTVFAGTGPSHAAG
ncbi:FAD-binding protein [Arthrobacter livingstonensis]|uniref:FAD-binding protein n=1 Tax=Arthrobacter livingstonensis TaxID=670078 RepID=A0A2V5L3P2_9MICC|nr:D-arabinono-1,4-lactone oxidase [Arthrobacter livingstonensis]PYI64734.1 FAD-binding protein [Arthrobacter livingstonensis]